MVAMIWVGGTCMQCGDVPTAGTENGLCPFCAARAVTPTAVLTLTNADGQRYEARLYRDPRSGLPCVDITTNGMTARRGMLMDRGGFAVWCEEQGLTPDEADMLAEDARYEACRIGALLGEE